MIKKLIGVFEINKIIGITGLSGSGKTTFAEILSNKLKATFISQDDFYIGAKAMSTQGKSSKNFDTLDALNCSGLIATFELIRNGYEAHIQIPRYDYALQAPVGLREEKITDMVLIEGHLIFTSPNILEYVDYLIYIDVDEAIAKERRFARDIVKRGFELHDCESYYTTYVYPQLEKITKLRNEADYLVEKGVRLSGFDAHVSSVCAYLKDSNL